jgi:hypothetical protein
MIRGFGDLRYAHAALDLPNVDDAGLAAYLYFVAQENAKRLVEKWPIPKIIVRALALELTIGFASRGEAVPSELVLLLAQMLDLPPDFVEDPVSLYSGNPSDRAHRRHRVLAEALDAKSVAETGKLMSLNSLEKAIRAEHGGGPSRSTLREWRADPDYRLGLNIAADQLGVATPKF